MQESFSIFDVLLEMLSGHGACVTRIDVLRPSLLVVYNHRINNGLPPPLQVITIYVLSSFIHQVLDANEEKPVEPTRHLEK